MIPFKVGHHMPRGCAGDAVLPRHDVSYEISILGSNVLVLFYVYGELHKGFLQS